MIIPIKHSLCASACETEKQAVLMQTSRFATACPPLPSWLTHKVHPSSYEIFEKRELLSYDQKELNESSPWLFYCCYSSLTSAAFVAKSRAICSKFKESNSVFISSQNFLSTSSSVSIFGPASFMSVCRWANVSSIGR